METRQEILAKRGECSSSTVRINGRCSYREEGEMRWFLPTASRCFITPRRTGPRNAVRCCTWWKADWRRSRKRLRALAVRG